MGRVDGEVGHNRAGNFAVCYSTIENINIERGVTGSLLIYQHFTSFHSHFCRLVALCGVVPTGTDPVT